MASKKGSPATSTRAKPGRRATRRKSTGAKAKRQALRTQIIHSTTPLKAATVYLRRGFQPVPIPYQSKAPCDQEWQKRRFTLRDLPDHFRKQRQNVGIHLGEPSGGLVDIDLDCPEALHLAPLLIQRTLTFGRKGAPRSHWLFVVKPVEPTQQFKDIDGTMLVEFRSTGAQTVFPPSRHESGEVIGFDSAGPGEPRPIHGAELKKHVRTLAAAVLIARHWPKKGSRQDAALALAGSLLRAGWDEERVKLFIQAVATAAKDEETCKRVGTVASTAKRLAGNDAATGQPALRTLLGVKVMDRVAEWLGIATSRRDSDILDGLFPPKGGENQRESVLHLTPVQKLLEESGDEGPDVVEGMLPQGGLSVLVSKPKVGKSTLARSLAVSVARGEAFLGRRCAECPVLLLALEDKRSEVRSHFNRMGIQHEPIFVHTGAVLGEDERRLLSLGQAIRDHQPGLVIIDTLYRFTAVRDANDYIDVTRGLDPLLNMARRSGCHILLCHHATKAHKEGGDDVLGSTGLFGSVDTLITLKGNDGARHVSSIQRYGENMPSTPVSLEPETRRVISGDSVRTARATERVDAILDALVKPRTEKELKKAVGGDLAQVTTLFRTLVKEGKVSKTGGGKKGDPYRYQRIVSADRPPKGEESKNKRRTRAKRDGRSGKDSR